MKHFGIIGKPLGHSQSKTFFTARFAERQFDADYTIHELESIDEVVPLLDTLDGFNVTSPYKQAIIPYLESVDPDAQAIGAVNVVSHKRGYNTDWVGARECLKDLVQPDTRALVLGTGGAARAVRYALQQLGVEVQTVSRSPGKADLTYSDLTREVVRAHTLIANCTPLGMYPKTDSCPQLPYEAMDSHTILYDLIYNPDQTLFMKKGAQYGAQTKNGLEMLLLQAFASWEFWHENK